MNINELLSNKEIKPKEKTEGLSKCLLHKTISVDELIEFAHTAKDTDKATCIEALEVATHQHPSIANEKSLLFVTESLTNKAPRVKWESARVIGNIAYLFPSKLDEAMNYLIANTEHSGTVVRWSAAFALGEILKLNTKINKTLLPSIEAICEKEGKNSIKKIYLAAIKKIPK
jgi:HEAT repeat protein